MHESEVKVKSLSRVRLFMTPWTAAYQAPPSMGFDRQEYWRGVPLPSLRHERHVQFLVQEDPLEEEMATHSSVLAWRIQGQRSLVGGRLWGRTESDTTEAT